MPQRFLEAMRSGEWLRTQWIIRVVYDLGATQIKDVSRWAEIAREAKRVLADLEAAGAVERRDATEQKPYGPVPRDEWRRL